MRQQIEPPDQAHGRPARPLPARRRARWRCRPSDVDLGALAREVTREFGARADLRGSRLELRTPERPPIARGDPDRVRQIIRILLDNALTHTPEGTKVTVTTYSVNRRAELTVSDEGSGIPQRVQSADLRALLHGRQGRRLRARAGDRQRARPAHGRPHHDQLQPPLHRLHARPAAGPGEHGAPPRRGHARQGPGVRARAALAAALLCLALLAGCGSSGGGDSTARAPAAEKAPPRSSSRPPTAASTPPRSSARPRPAWSRFARSSTRQRGRGLGLRAQHRRRDRHQRPRRHRRLQRPPQAGQGGLRRVPRPQRGPGQDPRLRPLRRRRPAQGRTRRLRPASASARQRRRPPGRPAGGGDRQPLRRAAVALERDHLRDRPLGEIADPVPDRGRDPDRRLDQPRQLRRAAARRRRPRGRHQPADRDQLRRQRRGRLRRARSRRSSARSPSCRKTATPNTPTSASPARRSTRSLPTSSASTPPSAACWPKSSPAARPRRPGSKAATRSSASRPANTGPAAT